ncbi:MAG: 5'-nucleotidase C-terminal domain-containing protein, partial [Candidatus Coatesbacteria bacterium]|nr:5'-nucleotidase C-terminal domain-containing protein [Candidatus Coatesbacteria bacterium]
VCDAIAEEFPTASVIIVNTGGIRGGFQAAGPITRSRVDEILPFHNKIVLMWVTGAELRTTLERSVRSLPESSGALLQLRGIKAYVDVEGSPIMSGYDGKVLKPGERIKSVTVAGKPLDENGEYLVATINYLAGGGDGYAELAKVERQMDTGKSLNDILANYIEQHSPIYPKRRVTYEFTSPN